MALGVWCFKRMGLDFCELTCGMIARHFISRLVYQDRSVYLVLSGVMGRFRPWKLYSSG